MGGWQSFFRGSYSLFLRKPVTLVIFQGVGAADPLSSPLDLYMFSRQLTFLDSLIANNMGPD